MKVKIILLSFFVSIAAHAHPADQDSLNQIPSGSSISLKNNYNVPPNMKVIMIKNGVRFFYGSNITSLCVIYLKESSTRDRNLKARTMTLDVQKISKAANWRSFHGIRMPVTDSAVTDVVCYSTQPITNLGEFRGVLKEHGISLNMSRPVDVNYQVELNQGQQQPL